MRRLNHLEVFQQPFRPFGFMTTYPQSFDMETHAVDAALASLGVSFSAP